MAVTLYEVGGCVRDELLGLRTKDIDFSAVVTDTDQDPFDHLRAWLNWNNFEIFTETDRSEKCLTIRAHFPKGMEQYGGRDVRRLTADFVLARKEGSYSDGRHPDEVSAGTLEDDLARRDFTVNAMAKDMTGKLIDLYGGQADLERRVLRCVGDAETRIREDSLRALRAVRFAVTKGFTLDDELWVVMRSDWLPDALSSVSVERKQQELVRAFKHDTLETLACLNQLSSSFRQAVFSNGLWLKPTLEH